MSCILLSLLLPYSRAAIGNLLRFAPSPGLKTCGSSQILHLTYLATRLREDRGQVGLLVPLLSLLLLSHPFRALAYILLFFSYTKLLCPPLSLPQKTFEGKGQFCIASVKLQPSLFQRSLLYCGTLKHFQTSEGQCLPNLPCKLYVPFRGHPPPADCDYWIEGTLSKKENSRIFHLKPTKKKSWEPIPHTFSLAKWRFSAKQMVHHYLKQHLKKSRTSSFLAALLTGDLDEWSLCFEFNRIGLQHILAISGLHFGLLAMVLGFFTRLFLSPKKNALFLIIFLSCYFFFIGNSPSVCRAWIALLFFLLGRLVGKRISALNALGMGMILELLIDPSCIQHLGFQLSFLATSAILLFYPACESLLVLLFPKRPSHLVAKMSLLNQHGYLFSALLRKSLALNLAVHLMLLPVLLYLFHTFPLLSLAYNLFFPFWVSLSLILLILSFPLPFLHPLNDCYTSYLLQLTSHPPAFLNFSLHVPAFSFSLLCTLLTLLLGAGILLNKWQIPKKSLIFSEREFSSITVWTFHGGRSSAG
jgi:competence protein ComEC